MQQYKKDAIWFLINETAKFALRIALASIFALGIFNYMHNCESMEVNLYDKCITSLEMTRIIITAIAPSAIIGYMVIKWKIIKRMLKEQGFE